jgi:hypothetical protein
MIYLAIGAIFQNEAPYLAEWIAFHQMMGVEHFYLYDNNSTDAFREILAPWMAEGAVTLLHWPGEFAQGAQRQAYEDCLNRSRGQARWVAFIDIDEFLFSPGHGSLPEALRGYEAFPGLVVHWQIFGSRSEAAGTEGLVIERFTHRARRNWVRNRRVKSIVDPARTLGTLSCHHFHYRDGATAVNERHQPIRVRSRPKAIRKFLRRFSWLLGPWMLRIDPYKGTFHTTRDCPSEVLRLHHYILKSEAEFAHKAERRKREWTYATSDRVYRHFFRYHNRNEVADPVLTALAPAVRAGLPSDQGAAARPSR